MCACYPGGGSRYGKSFIKNIDSNGHTDFLALIIKLIRFLNRTKLLRRNHYVKFVFDMTILTILRLGLPRRFGKGVRTKQDQSPLKALEKGLFEKKIGVGGGERISVFDKQNMGLFRMTFI